MVEAETGVEAFAVAPLGSDQSLCCRKGGLEDGKVGGSVTDGSGEEGSRASLPGRVLASAIKGSLVVEKKDKNFLSTFFVKAGAILSNSWNKILFTFKTSSFLSSPPLLLVPLFTGFLKPGALILLSAPLLRVPTVSPAARRFQALPRSRLFSSRSFSPTPFATNINNKKGHPTSDIFSISSKQYIC